MSIPGAALIFLSIPPPRPIRSNSSAGPTATNQPSNSTAKNDSSYSDSGDGEASGGGGSYGPPIVSSEDIVAAVPVTYSSNPLYTKGIHLYLHQ